MFRIRADVAVFFFLVCSAALSSTVSIAVSSALSVSERVAATLDDLPASSIPSGILYDRVLSLSEIDRYDGSASAKVGTLREWRQMLDEITRASVREPNWPSLASIDESTRRDLRAGAPDGVIPIVAIDFAYQRLRPDVLESGALVARGERLALGTGDAFLSLRVVAAAAARTYTYRGESVKFEFSRERYLSNDRPAPSTVEIDFEDGLGYRAVRLDQPVDVSYSTTGQKLIRMRLRPTDATPASENAFFVFDVRALGTPAPDDTLQITASIPYQSIAGTGEAYVYLAEEHASITNPVVVIEGFDLDNSMNWDELYALLNREQLLENLRALGYDAVVLNFDDAVTHIQRNAYVAVELIEQIQATISPSQDFALVGASMGGLVGRYALAHMETNGPEHRARTFISFDSPQKGASIPLGIQYWLSFFADDSEEAGALLATLDTPGARQMLVYHHTDPPGGTGQVDPLRVQLLNDFNVLGGYPSQPRKVAVANGSGAQVSQGFSAGSQIIDWEYTSFLVDVTGNVWATPFPGNGTIFQGLVDIIFLPEESQTVNVSGTLPYDNASGGWRNSMAQMDATSAPYGDIVALHPNHCFIPSVSALALDTSNLFYDIAGDVDILSHTPFDAVYFPSGNQGHVEINAENALWLLAEVQLGASSDVAEGDFVSAVRASIDAIAPNPSSGGARILLEIPRAGDARVAVHDVTGRQVALLADHSFAAGRTELPWDGLDRDGRSLAPGVYFIRLTGAGYAASGKALLR